MKKISSLAGLAMSVAYRTGMSLEEYLCRDWGVHTRCLNRKALREWFSYSANYAYWTPSGILAWVEGSTELSNMPKGLYDSE